MLAHLTTRNLRHAIRWRHRPTYRRLHPLFVWRASVYLPQKQDLSHYPLIRQVREN